MISEEKMRIVINNYFKTECDVDTSIRQAFEKGFRIGVKKGLSAAQLEVKPPKWVAEDRYVRNRFAVFPHCPQCNYELETGDCYCKICGQHIDWSEEDE